MCYRPRPVRSKWLDIGQVFLLILFYFILFYFLPKFRNKPYETFFTTKQVSDETSSIVRYT